MIYYKYIEVNKNGSFYHFSSNEGLSTAVYLPFNKVIKNLHKHPLELCMLIGNLERVLCLRKYY